MDFYLCLIGRSGRGISKNFTGGIIGVALLAVSGLCQEPDKPLRNQIDAAVSAAYQAAASGFPCTVKTRAKPKMIRWEEVDRCLNEAAGRVDWSGLSARLEKLRAAEPGVSASDFSAMVEASLSAYALVYEKVLAHKNPEALLPLTNSLLKYLPADSLQNLPVYDKVGTHVGSFLGVYVYERSGGLATANTYRLTLFQYSDRSGNVQSAGDKLLLDSFGIPWKDAMSHRGFRLPSDRLMKQD